MVYLQIESIVYNLLKIMSLLRLKKTEAFQYVTPAIMLIDIVSEGVLCSSGVDINDWENDGEGLDF